MSRIVIFNKPFNVLSQFTDESGRETLGNYINLSDFYPAGRLDRDSEGLLLLTDDGRLQHLISHPRHKMDKTYWVQMEGEITADSCQQLIAGVILKDGPARAIVAEPMQAPDVWKRDPPVRFRQAIPTSWLKLVINEGRNRQVRRMTAAIGFPTLRLIRYAIGPWSLDGIDTGSWKAMPVAESLLKQADKFHTSPDAGKSARHRGKKVFNRKAAERSR